MPASDQKTVGIFSRLANWTARASGHPIAFFLMVVIVLAWVASGPAFRFSDTWQLIINTFTDIVTLLMVFLIQNSQNRDSNAAQIKLNEIIRALEGAHNTLLSLDELSDDDLQRVRDRYTALAQKARQRLERGEPDTDSPNVDAME